MSTVNPLKSEDPAARYAWAEHLIWMEGGDPVPPSPGKLNWLPGILISTGLALLAFWLSRLIGQSGSAAARFFDPVMLSMILGLILGNAVSTEKLIQGTSIVVKKFLPIGVVLLGARMNFMDAISVGIPGVILSILVVLMAIGLLYGLRKWLGLEKTFACLLGVGTGICGGTAIVAVAPILKAREADVILGVGCVTLAGLVSMLVLPVIGAWMDFSQHQFGILAGLTIHQTPQAIAAGFAFGDEAGQVATAAKLTRVCMLAPVAVIIGRLAADGSTNQLGASKKSWYQYLPWFALGFLAMATLRSLGGLPEISIDWSSHPMALSFDSATALKAGSTFLLAASMVAIGSQTQWKHFRGVGLRVFGSVLLVSVFITATLATLIHFFIS